CTVSGPGRIDLTRVMADDGPRCVWIPVPEPALLLCARAGRRAAVSRLAAPGYRCALSSMDRRAGFVSHLQLRPRTKPRHHAAGIREPLSIWRFRSTACAG